MTTTIPVTSTLKSIVARINGDTEEPIEPDGTLDPVVEVWKNGVSLTLGTGFSVTIGSFVSGLGNLVTITLASQLAANDLVVAKVTFDYSVEGQVACFLQWICSGVLSGANGSSTYTDTVTDTAAQPVEGADVWITPVGQTSPRVDAATTNSLGQFTLRADPGQYSLHVQRSGKQSQTVTITIT
jgi:hypothetical protein